MQAFQEISSYLLRLLAPLTFTDLPNHPFLTVFVWKSAGSTDVHAYFSKYDL